MNNPGVRCDVCECMHNVGSNACNLQTIDVTHEKTDAKAVANPHFCKSFQQK